MTEKLPPLHPGGVLREEFIVPMGLSAGALAKACHVPRTRIERIAREEIGITPDTALRLAKFFGMSAEFWTRMQADYDLEMARRELADEIATIEARAA